MPSRIARFKRVQAFTASTTLTYGDSDATFTNAGATGAIVLTLPSAVPGMTYRFRVSAAYSYTVAVAGTDTMSLPSTGVPGTAGKGLVNSGTVGPTLEIQCTSTGTWSVMGFTGTWTAQP